VDLYSAVFIVPHTQGMDHTVVLARCTMPAFT